MHVAETDALAAGDPERREERIARSPSLIDLALASN